MSLTRLSGISLALLGALVLASPASLAAGTSSTPEAEQVDYYKTAKKLIDDQDFAKAIPLLEQSIQANGASADAYNLLGFAHRKLGDTQKGMDYYMKALAIEPSHLGTNEYLGELYLELNDLPKAEERLAVLETACGSCEEYQDLDKAVLKFKAANGQ